MNKRNKEQRQKLQTYKVQRIDLATPSRFMRFLLRVKARINNDPPPYFGPRYYYLRMSDQFTHGDVIRTDRGIDVVIVQKVNPKLVVSPQKLYSVKSNS